MAMSSGLLESGKVLLKERGRRLTSCSTSSSSSSLMFSHSNTLKMMPSRRRGQRLRAAMIDSENAMSSCVSISNMNSLYQIQPLFVCKEEEEKERMGETTDLVTSEKLDEWIRGSVAEIVKNIGEAPFLVQIFSQGPSSMVRLETEEALPENWLRMKKKWNQTSCKPDGVILVEELKDEEEAGDNKTWGLVIQGRGMDCAASCYVLNTCRVRSSFGFCTHFCLQRAKCFGEPLEKQLRTAWLQGR